MVARCRTAGHAAVRAGLADVAFAGHGRSMCTASPRQIVRRGCLPVIYVASVDLQADQTDIRRVDWTAIPHRGPGTHDNIPIVRGGGMPRPVSASVEGAAELRGNPIQFRSIDHLSRRNNCTEGIRFHALGVYADEPELIDPSCCSRL